jgi:hypothetical protein
MLGIVEPHAPLLTALPDTQSLYKVMSIENLLRSVEVNYLYFNCVYSYANSPGADPYDGKQLPKDQPGNASLRFVRAPKFSAADGYDQARARTYACCFSLENSAFIWSNYGNGRGKGKAGIVFNFGRLRAMINRKLRPGNAIIEHRGERCRQVFSVNYGLIDYVERRQHDAVPALFTLRF